MRSIVLGFVGHHQSATCRRVGAGLRCKAERGSTRYSGMGGVLLPRFASSYRVLAYRIWPYTSPTCEIVTVWCLHGTIGVRIPKHAPGPRSRLVTQVLYFVAACVLAFEEWIWNHAFGAPASGWTAAAISLDRGLAVSWRTPAQALALYVLPVLVVWPLKGFALGVIGHGQVALGFAMLFLAKVIGTAVLARLWQMTEPAISTYRWIRQGRNRVPALAPSPLPMAAPATGLPEHARPTRADEAPGRCSGGISSAAAPAGVASAHSYLRQVPGTSELVGLTPSDQ